MSQFINQWHSTLMMPFSHLGPFTKYAMLVALVLFGIAIALAAWRLYRGPADEDMILALDTLYINSLAVTILLGIVFATTVYFEVALIIAMLGFIGTVVMAKFLAEGDIVK
jgi:multicomponent K+:H+ antiporter subunit F